MDCASCLLRPPCCECYANNSDCAEEQAAVLSDPARRSESVPFPTSLNFVRTHSKVEPLRDWPRGSFSVLSPPQQLRQESSKTEAQIRQIPFLGKGSTCSAACIQSIVGTCCSNREACTFWLEFSTWISCHENWKLETSLERFLCGK